MQNRRYSEIFPDFLRSGFFRGMGYPDQSQLWVISVFGIKFLRKSNPQSKDLFFLKYGPYYMGILNPVD